MLFGIIQNANYLLCDRLIKDCANFLIYRLKCGSADSYISHEAFDKRWVPIEVVEAMVKEERWPYWTIQAVFKWLDGSPPVGDPKIKALLERCHNLAGMFTRPQMNELLRLSPSAVVQPKKDKRISY